MTDSEIVSLVLRIAALFVLGCCAALNMWWHLQGPTAAVVLCAVLTFVTCLMDLGRHAK